MRNKKEFLYYVKVQKFIRCLNRVTKRNIRDATQSNECKGDKLKDLFVRHMQKFKEWLRLLLRSREVFLWLNFKKKIDKIKPVLEEIVKQDFAMLLKEIFEKKIKLHAIVKNKINKLKLWNIF